MVAIAVAPSDAATDYCESAPRVSHDGARVVVWLDGEQDIATVAGLADLLARAISFDVGDLIVDLSGVTFMDASTIGVLMRSRNILRGQFRNLTLRSPSNCAIRVLDVCGLTDLLEPEPGQAEPVIRLS